MRREPFIDDPADKASEFFRAHAFNCEIANHHQRVQEQCSLGTLLVESAMCAFAPCVAKQVVELIDKIANQSVEDEIIWLLSFHFAFFLEYQLAR
jgi:hypothetical protein